MLTITNLQRSFNSTSASDIDFKLDFEFNPPLPRTRYLGEWGPFKTIASGLEAAREHGLEERLPREGYLVESDGVWLHAYPLFIDYTWGLMALTLRQVAADLETKGKFACRWELSRIDDGRLGRIYGRGDMWPGLSRKENAVRTA